MAIDLTTLDVKRIQWVIDYLKKGSAGKFLDSTAVEQLSQVFGQTCGFKCGCPGTFQEGMRDQPWVTILQAMLC